MTKNMSKEWEIEDTYLVIKHNLYKKPKGIQYSIATFCPRGVITVVALTKKEELIFIEQFRPAANKKIINLPGGGVDKGESAKEAAKRELEEETGFTGRDFKNIGNAFFGPAQITDKCTIFFVRDVKRLKKKKINNDLAEREKKILFLKIGNALKLIKQGKIKCMTTIAAILLAKEKGLIK